MEVKEKSKKRELIKSIAIVFLAVMLLLTFFSNTIMNRSLAEVATQSISSGTINAKIRGSGTVSPNESYEVVIDQTREVRSICVSVGDIVSQGDLLFVLGDMESQELQTAQEQLDSLNLQYQQQLLNLSKEYATNDRSVQALREELQDAVKQRDDNKVTDADISQAKGDLATAKNSLTQTNLALEELQAYLADSDDYTEAQAAVTKWTSQMESAQQKITDYTSQLNELSSGSTGTNYDVVDAATKLETAENQLKYDWAAYESWFAELASKATGQTVTVSDSSDIQKYQGAISTYLTQQALLPAGTKSGTGTETGEGEESADTPAVQTGDVRDENYTTYKKVFDTLVADQAAVDSAKQTYDRLVQDQWEANGTIQQQRAAIQAKLSQANSDYAAARQQLQQASAALTQAESANAALKEQIKSYEATQREQTAQVESLTENVSALESKKTVYDQAVELVKQKERAIEDALTGKDIDKQLDNLELQAIQQQIDKAQEQVDKYTEDTVDTEITANVSGRISAINVSAGKDTVAGTAMAVIDVVDQGYVVKIPVTAAQAKQVKVGDSANVTNYYWGEELEATLESIIADPENPGTGKLLVFRVTGDIDNGTSITLSIGQRSANYDTIIPKSALREDTNGYFVLVITVKSSPLSNRYIATRVDVQVLAEDDTSAAVSGLSAGDFVITTSSKPVEAGSQVRMVEN